MIKYLSIGVFLTIQALFEVVMGSSEVRHTVLEFSYLLGHTSDLFSHPSLMVKVITEETRSWGQGIEQQYFR